MDPLDNKNVQQTQETNFDSSRPSPGQAFDGPSSVATSPSSPNKVLYGLLIAIALLFMSLLVVLIMLLNKKDSVAVTDETNSQNNSTSASNDSDDTTSTSREQYKVVKTVPLSDNNLELLIYEPKQNASNTTINFGIKNTCDSCNDDIFAAASSLLGSYNRSNNSYLVDDAVGQKYNYILDSDKKVLTTANCYESLSSGEVINCFMSFSKVDSGTTVAVVLGKARADGILIP